MRSHAPLPSAPTGVSPAPHEDRPPDCEYHWSWCGYVHVIWPASARAVQDAGGGALQLAFVFNGDERGWYAGRPGSYVRLDVAIPPPAGAAPAYTVLLREAVAEFDRRIARSPGEALHRRAKLTYLHRAGEFEEARRTALAWVAFEPRAAMPRYALADIERAERSGLPGLWGLNEIQEAVRDDWGWRNFESYARWRVFAARQGCSAASRFDEMSQGPLFSEQTEWLYGEVFLFEDAQSLCWWFDSAPLRAFCERWRQTAEGMAEQPLDRSYHAFLAAAYLKSGDFTAAQTEVARAVECYRAGQAWADPSALQAAIERREPQFDFAPEGPPTSEQHWRLRLNCPPPAR